MLVHLNFKIKTYVCMHISRIRILIASRGQTYFRERLLPTRSFSHLSLLFSRVGNDIPIVNFIYYLISSLLNPFLPTKH